MRSEKDIGALIRTEARRSFGAESVIDAWVRRAIDHDGDPIFLVRIVVEPRFLRLVTTDRIDFAVQLRGTLIALGEMAFPVIDYLVLDDVEKYRAEAA